MIARRTVLAALVSVVLATLATPVAAARVQSAAAAVQVPAGHLTPPTATRYADPAWYDVVDAALLEGSDVMRVRLELGAIDPSGGLPIGITQPIIEIYLDTGPGGATELLPGSGMRMPEGDGWNVALRITGDGAWGWLADEFGTVDLARPVTLDATAVGRTIDVRTPFAPASGGRVYAISGVYDPFRADGWRQTTRLPSPWAFSSPEPTLSVVDVFPADAATTARSVAQGVLPRRATVGVDVGASIWITLMLGGLAIAIVGLWWRRRRSAVPPAPSAAPAAAVPRYTRLDNPARSAAPEVVAVPITRALRRNEDVSGDVLIGERDFDVLLERLDRTLGDPARVDGTRVGGDGAEGTRVDADGADGAGVDADGADGAGVDGAGVEPDGEPARDEHTPRLALPAPDASWRYGDATQRDDDERREGDRVERSS